MTLSLIFWLASAGLIPAARAQLRTGPAAGAAPAALPPFAPPLSSWAATPSPTLGAAAPDLSAPALLAAPEAPVLAAPSAAAALQAPISLDLGVRAVEPTAAGNLAAPAALVLQAREETPVGKLPERAGAASPVQREALETLGSDLAPAQGARAFGRLGSTFDGSAAAAVEVGPGVEALEAADRHRELVNHFASRETDGLIALDGNRVTVRMALDGRAADQADAIRAAFESGRFRFDWLKNKELEVRTKTGQLYEAAAPFAASDALGSVHARFSSKLGAEDRAAFAAVLPRLPYLLIDHVEEGRLLGATVEVKRAGLINRAGYLRGGGNGLPAVSVSPSPRGSEFQVEVRGKDGSFLGAYAVRRIWRGDALSVEQVKAAGPKTMDYEDLVRFNQEHGTAILGEGAGIVGLHLDFKGSLPQLVVTYHHRLTSPARARARLLGAFPQLRGASLRFVDQTAADAALLRRLSGEADRQALRSLLPRIDGKALIAIAEKIEAAKPLGRGERLQLAFLRLAAEERPPADGAEAYRQIETALRLVEERYLDPSVVAAAFAAYNAGDPASRYEPSEHPPEFADVLKPPAQRYNKRDIFRGKDVITQINHVTIVDRHSGAVEIQEIDPAYRSALRNPGAPLVAAIMQDREYFRSLPKRRSWVVYRKPGRNGREVWQGARWQEDRWAPPAAAAAPAAPAAPGASAGPAVETAAAIRRFVEEKYLEIATGDSGIAYIESDYSGQGPRLGVVYSRTHTSEERVRVYLAERYPETNAWELALKGVTPRKTPAPPKYGPK